MRRRVWIRTDLSGAWAAVVTLSLKKIVVALSLGVFVAAGPSIVVTPVQAATTQKVKTQQAKTQKAKASGVKKTSAKKTSATKSVKRTNSRKSLAKAKHAVKKSKKPRRQARRRVTAPSQATLAGLRKTPDLLSLGSSVALVVDQDTGEELFSKNADIELPIASVTKLMTALVIAESGLKMDERIRITREDYVRSNARSKLRSGMRMTRAAVLKAALMSSDNRAATALARTYPGGRKAFVRKMNETAERLGMTDSVFADPSGLDNRNHATARDLAKLVAEAHKHEMIRDSSTMQFSSIRAGRQQLKLVTTNRLIGNPDWNIGVQKTGFTTAAGRCMVVQSEFADRRVVMVLLDSPNSAQRAADMQTMRTFVENEDRINDQFGSVRPYEVF